MLTFGEFANEMIYVTKENNVDMVNELLGCVYLPLDLRNKNGDPVYFNNGECTHLLKGERDVTLEIQRGTGEKVVIDGSIKYFSENITPLIIPSLLSDFLDKMKKCISVDSSISQTKKEELLCLAKEQTLAEFLASVCLYTINKTNAIQVQKISPNNLPYQNKYFSGRVDKLDYINNLLKNKRQKVNICQTVVGLGGVGKTQLAIEYAYRFNYKYKTFIWFVNAETSNSVFESFYNFAKTFNLQISSDFMAEALQRIIRLYLSENNSWLIIFDNIETIDTILPYLPNKINGHILITTRNVYIDYGIPIELDVFDEEEAVLFLKKRLSASDSLALEFYEYDDFNVGSKLLSDRLGRLPLALEQAAAYIKVVKCSISDYLDLLGQASVEAFEDGYASPQYYTSIVTSTWNISFKALSISAQQLMNLCAYMAPDKIPVEFFVKMREKLPMPLKEDLSEIITTNRVVTNLRTYSLTGGNSKFINIHRLVQEVVRNSHK